MAAKVNFVIKANGSWIRTWQVKNNGVPFNISNYTFELEVKKKRGSAETPFLNLTMGNGITMVDASIGKFQIEIPPNTSIVSNQTYFYDLIAIVNNKAYVWIEGQMTFEPGVSYRT